MSFTTQTATRPKRPRYQEIQEALLAEIEAGRYVVGERLPTEQELCARFEASRHTVRDALRQLQQSGLIVRRRGSGSVLAAQYPTERFTNSISSLENLFQYAAETRLEILTIDKILTEGAISQLLRCRDGEAWVRVCALRRAPSETLPIAYTEIYLPITYEAIVSDIGSVQAAVYAMIEERFHVQVTKVRQSLEAVAVDRNAASRLAIDVGWPALRITRRYYAEEGAQIEVAVSTHPAGRYRYEMTLERRPEGQSLYSMHERFRPGAPGRCCADTSERALHE